MTTPAISVREIQLPDITLITNYWLNSEPAYLQAMGVDLDKIPGREQWIEMLQVQLNLPYRQKKSYCIIWLANSRPIGHCNVNKIIFGQEAYMHLHIWDPVIRSMRLGSAFIKITLPYFFRNLELKKICCEPFAYNPAPNKVLAKAGFRCIKEYVTIPGALNFEQPVKYWEISRENFLEFQVL